MVRYKHILLTSKWERLWMESADFEAALGAFPAGYSEGIYEGRRYGVILRRSGDGRRNSLLARELAGTDIVSFNLYRLGSGNASLKPCEMRSEEHTSELQSLMRISYAVFCLKNN